MTKFLGPFFSKPLLSKEVDPDFSMFLELESVFSKIPPNATIRVAVYMWNQDDGINKKGFRNKWKDVPGNPKSLTNTFLDRAKQGDCKIILDNYITEYHKNTLISLSDAIGEQNLIIDPRTGVNDPEYRRELFENEEKATSGYMHDKFFLISELEGLGKYAIIQTTANINVTQCHQFNNTIVIYDNEELYNKYLLHWNNLHSNIIARKSGQFLEKNPNIFKDEPVDFKDKVSAFFFPRYECPIEKELERVLERDENAQIDVCMAYLTRYGFKKLLRRLNKRHRVRILISEEDQNDSTLSYFVERWNVPAKIIENRKYNQEIYVDENGDERIRDNWQARMHHKFVLIKEIKKRIVWTGSYNITYPGLNLNDEAILRIEDPYVYKSYLKTFNMLWQPSKLKEIKLLQ